MAQSYLVSHAAEMVAAVAGFMNIYLIARNNIWNYFFGILNVTLFAVVFFHAKLYADMGLQIAFLVLQFYGIYLWLHVGCKKIVRPISTASYNVLFIALFSSLFLFSFVAFILHHYTDSTTVYADAFITALSLVAQWMMSNKWLEHWYLWIVVNLVSIILYLIKGLYFATGLYVVLLYICSLGYLVWKKSLIHQHQVAAC